MSDVAATQAVRQVSDSSFADEVLAAERPVLVDFFAGWCGPCHAIAPSLEQIAQERAGEVEIVKLDVDANPETTNRFGDQEPADPDAVQGRPAGGEPGGRAAQGPPARLAGRARLTSSEPQRSQPMTETSVLFTPDPPGCGRDPQPRPDGADDPLARRPRRRARPAGAALLRPARRRRPDRHRGDPGGARRARATSRPPASTTRRRSRAGAR